MTTSSPNLSGATGQRVRGPRGLVRSGGFVRPVASDHPPFHKFVTTELAICGTLMRMNDGPPGEILRSGDLEVRPSEFLVLVKGRVLNFTKKEQQLLAVMMRSEGRILSRAELYALVWGNKLKPGDRTVDVYVRKLRLRLSTAIPESTFIHTHFGFGYRYSPEPSHDAQKSVTSG